MTSIFKRGWINLSIYMGIDSFRNYIEEMESNLNTQLNRLDSQYNEETQKLSKDEAAIIFEYKYEDQFYYLRDEFPDILRKSFVISLYSFLEQELFKICMHIEKNKNINFLSDINKNFGVFKSYKYLSDVAKIDLTVLNEDWEKIKKFNKIRNHYVHNGSNTLNKSIKPRTTLERNVNHTLEAFIAFNLAQEDKDYNQFRDTIKFNNILLYEIKITSEFCSEVLNIIKNFFDKLTDILKRQLNH